MATCNGYLPGWDPAKANTEAFRAFVGSMDQMHADLKYARLWIDGKLVDAYSAMPVTTRLNTWSLSKSFVGAAVGIAMDEGLVSMEEPLADAFPEYLTAQTDPLLCTATVRDYLTMSVGLEKSLFYCDQPERYTERDWVRYYFQNARCCVKPGTVFHYSNFVTFLLTCLVEKRAGVNLLEYLRERLFEPIGIGNPDWTLTPKGHVMGANGLYVTVDEIGAFGKLLLGNGAFDGRRIVSESFMEQAMRPQIETHDDQFPAEAFRHGYGYQIWMTHVPGVVMCAGRYGQSLNVCREKRAVFACQSLEGFLYNDIANSAAELFLQLP